MFQNLRPGNPVYILYKNDNPHCDVASVVSVSKPEPKYKTATVSFPQEMVVHVTVKINDKTETLQGLDANLVIADNQNVVVSCDKNAINSEIETLKRTSEDILNSIDYHKKVVSSCDDMLKEINPSFAKEKEQEEEIRNLRLAVENTNKNVDEKIGSIYEMLEKVLAEKASSKNSKTS